MRRSWLAHHVLADAAGRAADARAHALGSAVRERLLAGGDALADVSAPLAARYYRRAPAAWTRLGPEGFERWRGLGAGLACGAPPCVPGALAFFGVSPTGFGPGGLETAAAWCDLARRVTAVSRRLGATFLETTAGMLARPDAVERLGAWVEAGLALHEARGWQGLFLAQGFFEAAPAALDALGPGQYGRWAETGLALAGARRERGFFATLPPALARWTDAEREGFLGLVTALVAVSPADAETVYRELPGAVARLAPGVRAALLGVLAAVDVRLAGPLAALVPVAGAVVQAVPRGRRREALGLVHALVGPAPDAALAALGTLPRVYEEADPAGVRRWFEAGRAVAAENPHAGRAFFALESRTGLGVLRAASTAATLEETGGVWRKLVRMLGGEALAVEGAPETSLRPPLEAEAGAARVTLPERVDWMPTHEENCRLYRLLAAHVAGRRAAGTYADPGLLAALRHPDQPAPLEELFLLAEGVRVHHRLARAYPGIAADARWAATRLLERWAVEEAPSGAVVLDALLAVVLADGRVARWPAWLPESVGRAVERLVAPLARPEATARDALGVAHALVSLLTAPAARQARRLIEAERVRLEDLGILDPGAEEDTGPPGAEAPWVEAAGGEQQLPDDLRLRLAPPGADPPGAGRPLSAEELRRLLAAGVTIGQAGGAGEEGPGLPVTDLEGKIPMETLEAVRRLVGHPEPRRRARRGVEQGDARAFLYDEWDERIGDYRSRWCRLFEVDVAGDAGEFFGRALADYAGMIPEVRRQFQRLRPEMYRTVRGLEDGEDFDLNAVVDARSEARARRPPSPKLYKARVREARDVATLFLVDMSASTDEPLEKTSARRIIDVTKEALVVMTQALDALGDAYAIYGFSGEGRANVEVYPVKGFNEPLGPTVKGRIGGIVPKRSTRMGTALRHATRKLAAVGARSKHLILLSDGFPQDVDYGEDRRSHRHGIRDTAVALREAEAAGVVPFCITVDRAGHDYLRVMCEESRYVVIEDVGALPRELPKIYQRVVRV